MKGQNKRSQCPLGSSASPSCATLPSMLSSWEYPWQSWPSFASLAPNRVLNRVQNSVFQLMTYKAVNVASAIFTAFSLPKPTLIFVWLPLLCDHDSHYTCNN